MAPDWRCSRRRLGNDVIARGDGNGIHLREPHSRENQEGAEPRPELAAPRNRAYGESSARWR
jgi:hypothetical protein